MQDNVTGNTSTNVGILEKGVDCVLGQSTPASQETYLTGHVPVPKMIFLTINFPQKDKIRLNKKMNYKYEDYKTLEQRIIIKRICNLLQDLDCEYILAFEYCKSLSLHAHLIIRGTISPRDLEIETRRFYNVPYHAFAVAKPLPTQIDVDKVLQYILVKEKKDYQTTGFIPLYNNPSFLNIEQLINGLKK